MTMLIWFVKQLNAIRRWFGKPEHPKPISGVQSVLFVLQAKSPLSFLQLQQQTKILAEDLRRVLLALKNEGRIRYVDEVINTSSRRMYFIVYPRK